MSLETIRALLAEVEPGTPWEATVNDMHGFHAAPEDADAIASDDAGEEPSEIRLSGGTARMAPNLHGSDETARGPGSYRSIDRIAEEDAFSMDEWEIRERHAQYELIAELRNHADALLDMVDAVRREHDVCAGEHCRVCAVLARLDKEDTG